MGINEHTLPVLQKLQQIYSNLPMLQQGYCKISMAIEHVDCGVQK